MGKIFGYLYKVINKINGNIYIGITTRSIKKRWEEHIKDSFNYYSRSYNYHFHRAIRKYGIENFIIEQLDKAYSLEELKNQEIYYINKYDTYNNGYNSTRGGEFSSNKIPVVQLTLDGIFIKEWDSMTKAETELNITDISSNCTGKKKSSGGFLWIYKEDYKNGIRKVYENINDYNRKSIIQLDLQGLFIKEWASAREIERELGFGYKNISLCCLGKTKKAYDFMWVFSNEYKKSAKPTKYINRHYKPTILLDLKGNYIKTFESAIYASQELGISESAITQCCRGKRGKVYNFIFMYKLDWDKGKRIEPYISQEKPIIQLDLKGKFIKEWTSGMEATRNLKIHNSNLVKCLKGKRNMCGGFKWMYASEYYNKVS